MIRSVNRIITLLVFGVLFLAACSGRVQPTLVSVLPTSSSTPAEPPSATIPQPTALSPVPDIPTDIATALPPTSTPGPQPLRFAVIGDYGSGDRMEGDVAALVRSWQPDLVITTGDNNYPDGTAETIDENIGQFYHQFISPYLGSYGEGAQENRFFPSLGNHDWHAAAAQPYLDYFNLPGNERYYDFTWGSVHFFALDSNKEEPDGAELSSTQANWLQSRLSNSGSPWKIVYMHHPPYSSGRHGSIKRMQWPFAEWGADVVISGHDHTYERISRDGILYIVNGLGGASRYSFPDNIDGSVVRYNEDHGAMLVEVSEQMLHVQFVNRDGIVIDDFELKK
ncbi:MAG: metallophosphoesterase [Chloroflexota bacterium]|nr:MAG: metallophosphoesterase [Chloroflexota bacterium]